MLPTDSPSNTGASAPTSRPSNTQRSFTVPARLSIPPPRRASTSSVSSSEEVETLFTHTSASIISFSTQGSGFEVGTISSPKSPSGNEVGTLPWSSPSEIPVATGALRIYRVPGTVSFLNSGNFLHPILPRAACWCVDGESKFALRIPRPNSYYRIELPYESDEDKEKVEDLKKVLDNILRYEKVPCPFQRGFEVEVPEIPATPLRRSTFQTDSKVKRWTLNKIWEPENAPNNTNGEGSSSNARQNSNDEGQHRRAKSTSINPFTLPRTPSNPRSITGMGDSPQPAQEPTASRPRSSSVAFIRQRFLSEPFINRVPTGLASPTPPPIPPKSQPDGDAASISSGSADSFYSLDEPSRRSSSLSFMDAESMADEVPNGSNEEEYSFRGRHKRQVSELTIRPGPDSRPEPLKTPTAPYGEGRIHSPPSTPPPLSNSEDTIEPPLLDVPTPPDTLKLRRLTGATQRRAFSPMPHPRNMLYRTPSQQQPGTASMIVQKTMEILMGPPSNLVALMLHIAAKISFRLRNFASQGSTGDEVLPGTWDSDNEEGDWGEDDYGIPLRHVGSRSSSRGRPLSEYSNDYHLGAID